MLINYCSDLHLEFDIHADDFAGALRGLANPDNADVLVLAGDITVKNRVRWIELMSSQYKHVVYVFGNHEFYKSNLDSVERKTREALAHLENVHVLQNQSVTLDGVRFHGTTLWTDLNRGNPLTGMAAEGAMNDFRLIRCDNGESRWTANRWTREHATALTFLTNAVQPGDVVVTHHAPSFQSIHPRYKGQELNYAYASDLEDFITAAEPSYFFHGHVHDSFFYAVGKTIVACNPRGYAGHEINPNFNPYATVEL